ncbi:putative Phytocyanin domain, cupredoxin [Helianthus annuus]|uniref:Phytocyanin domain, cupredoxin n=1 Tax=Helianthus annuus TaxID=4232 RepID=A0A251TC54_HELAN|nr:uncharacterized protein LOC110892144 [Helianthus annuus]KAF5781690.1 putative Phytocyanin domain, cupredoxin [Helianthus annuus]KAJ0509014.1 putative Phytocyanin domain, cupredoxin [Helianthus annuus]KAJ0870342.1 putative Phytocyanin domain, cupredoxin [Helianthus annuus]KAJ0874824.1 putative Phytocyanin domain, cupredoxin [Helianthus annuus]
MAQGRGGAMVAMKVICLLAVALQCEAASFLVGGWPGWNPKFDLGAMTSAYKAGDIFVFKYVAGYHDVVVVNKTV